MGLIPTNEDIAKKLAESADYRCRYCGHIDKSFAWKTISVCVNWTTLHRDPNAFDLCPKCNCINTVEIKNFDETEYKIKQFRYDLVKVEAKTTVYDYASTVEEAIEWHKLRKRGHPDDIFPENDVLTYRNEIITYDK